MKISCNRWNWGETYEYASTLLPLTSKEKTYTDLTGHFRHKSSHGNEYLFVTYDFDSNAILVEAMKNRQAKTIVKAWNKLHKQSTKHGHLTKISS